MKQSIMIFSLVFLMSLMTNFCAGNQITRRLVENQTKYTSEKHYPQQYRDSIAQQNTNLLNKNTNLLNQQLLLLQKISSSLLEKFSRVKLRRKPKFKTSRADSIKKVPSRNKLLEQLKKLKNGQNGQQSKPILVHTNGTEPESSLHESSQSKVPHVPEKVNARSNQNLACEKSEEECFREVEDLLEYSELQHKEKSDYYQSVNNRPKLVPDGFQILGSSPHHGNLACGKSEEECAKEVDQLLGNNINEHHQLAHKQKPVKCVDGLNGCGDFQILGGSPNHGNLDFQIQGSSPNHGNLACGKSEEECAKEVDQLLGNNYHEYHQLAHKQKPVKCVDGLNGCGDFQILGGSPNHGNLDFQIQGSSPNHGNLACGKSEEECAKEVDQLLGNNYHEHHQLAHKPKPVKCVDGLNGCDDFQILGGSPYHGNSDFQIQGSSLNNGNLACGKSEEECAKEVDQLLGNNYHEHHQLAHKPKPVKCVDGLNGCDDYQILVGSPYHGNPDFQIQGGSPYHGNLACGKSEEECAKEVDQLLGNNYQEHHQSAHKQEPVKCVDGLDGCDDFQILGSSPSHGNLACDKSEEECAKEVYELLGNDYHEYHQVAHKPKPLKCIDEYYDGCDDKDFQILGSSPNHGKLECGKTEEECAGEVDDGKVDDEYY